jgi:hypothetical protein
MIGLFDSLKQRVTTLYNSLLHAQTSAHSHVFNSRCSVATSNGGRSLSSWFPNWPRLQLPASHSNSSQRLNLSSSLTHLFTHQPTNSTQLDRISLTILFTTSRHEQHSKHLSSVVYGPLPSNGRCRVVCFAGVA